MAFDDDYYYGFTPYVSAAARRARAARELATLRKKGQTLSPVAIDGRRIARTFWGEAWCGNLERYSDYANRLPRGRAYVRNGSVVDLRIESGRVTALVSGSTMYTVKVGVHPLTKARWAAICRDCSGAIDSVVELLQGRLSDGVMTRLCQDATGMFPSPKEIGFRCSCPDWASMCKHVAAVLYGIGARLDQRPELLFTLRDVDQQDLIASAGSSLAKTTPGPRNGADAKVLASDDLSGMFGIEIASGTESPVGPPAVARPPAPAKAASAAAKRTRASSAGKASGAGKGKPKASVAVKTKSAVTKAKTSRLATARSSDAAAKTPGTPRAKVPVKAKRASATTGPASTAPPRRERAVRLTPAERQAVMERMVEYWAQARAEGERRDASRRRALSNRTRKYWEKRRAVRKSEKPSDS